MNYAVKLLDPAGRIAKVQGAMSRTAADELAKTFSRKGVSYIVNNNNGKIMAIFQKGWRIDAPIQMDLCLPFDVPTQPNVIPLPQSACARPINQRIYAATR